MQKTSEFLRYLQQNVFVSCFIDPYFKSFVTIPKLEIYKCKKSKSWVMRILLLEELFDYPYPFKYPDLFEYLVLKVLLNIFIYENSFNNIQFQINEFVI